MSEQYPHIYFRIINCGGNAYGTTRLLLHFQEFVDYNPDLVFLYSGHNEFNERYMKDTYYKDNFLSKANSWLLEVSKFYQWCSYRVNSLIEFNVRKIKETKHPFFPPDFKLQWNGEYDKNEVYTEYRNNILQMIALANKENINFIVSTVAYNRLYPVFNKEAYEKCKDYYEAQEFDKAKECFEHVVDISPAPHRATRTSNRIIKEIAENYEVPIVKVDDIIIKNAAHGIPGPDLFSDHCHLNDSGNKILQETLFAAIIDMQIIPENENYLIAEAEDSVDLLIETKGGKSVPIEIIDYSPEWVITFHGSSTVERIRETYILLHALVEENLLDKKVTTGIPLSLYYMYDPENNIVDMAAGITISDSIEPGFGLQIARLGGKVVKASYIGSYQDFNDIYLGMMKWINESKMYISGPFWETYEYDSKKTDPSEWQTTIFFPVDSVHNEELNRIY